MTEAVSVERKGRLAIVRLDNPPANVLSRAVLGQFERVFTSLENDLPGAVVITGTERIFCAGADVSEFEGPARAAEIAGAFARALDILARLPRATVAAVAGVAVGGGCELALACDFRFAAEDARFGQPEILLGVIPGAGGTQRLTRVIGPARTKELVMTGRMLPADEALAIGLVNRVVERSELLEEAVSFADELAAGAVVAQGFAKRAIDDGLDLSLADGLALERRLFSEIFETDDASIGISSFLASGPGKATFVGS